MIPCLWSLPLVASVAPHEPVLPAGFVVEEIGDSWRAPTALAFLDANRLLVAEKPGVVWLVEGREKKNIVWTDESEALDDGSRGLLGLAVHPQFASNGWIYLLISVDPDGDLVDDEEPTFSRLVRYRTFTNAQGELVTDPASRFVMIGLQWPNGIPSIDNSHAGGRLAFMSDGSLLLSHGDGAHWQFTDFGGNDPTAFGPGRFGPEQDVGALRSQELASLAGKILRIDPTTGLGLPDNPFYTGDPAAPASRVWALGLRNPFRFTLVPGTGPREALFVCDVGSSYYEEINLCRGGENFGWPCYESAAQQPQYFAQDPHGYCDGIAGTATPPWLAWHHTNPGTAGFVGHAATGALVYSGTSYPAVYRGALFFCDFSDHWMKVATLDADLRRTSVLPFGTELDSPIELVAHPANGDLVCISLEYDEHRVLRLRYAPGNQAPQAIATAVPDFGPAPLTVHLDGRDSRDPDGDALSYSWDLGDGTVSFAPELDHVYTGSLPYRGSLTITDTFGESDTTEFLISPDNTPPTIVALTSPLDDGYFVPGIPVFLRSNVADVQDDDAGVPLDVRWRIDLVHDHHVHESWATVPGENGAWTPAPHDDGSISLIVHLIARDSQGLETRRTLDLFDSGARPYPHLLDVREPRLGHLVTAVAHADYPTPASGPRADLTFEWGDGEVDVFEDVEHHGDITARHEYPAPGTYTLRVTAADAGTSASHERLVVVRKTRPSVAIFRPLTLESSVPVAEQEAIATALAARLAPENDVFLFDATEGAELAAWIDANRADGVLDALVVIDLVPSTVYAGESDGSRAEEWLEAGNALVCTGALPLGGSIGANGALSIDTRALDSVLDSGPYVGFGLGPEALQPGARRRLPSLTPVNALHSIRHELVTAPWHVRRAFTQGHLKTSNAIELAHDGGGIYAQFYCLQQPGLPRTAVLGEYLEDLLRPKATAR